MNEFIAITVIASFLSTLYFWGKASNSNSLGAGLGLVGSFGLFALSTIANYLFC